MKHLEIQSGIQLKTFGEDVKRMSRSDWYRREKLRDAQEGRRPDGTSRKTLLIADVIFE